MLDAKRRLRMLFSAGHLFRENRGYKSNSLSSHSRLHGSTSYRVPWAYDEEAVDVVRFFVKLKARLIPYLYETAIFTN